MSPARTTISTAVARYSGSGKRRLRDALDHTNLHATFLDAVERHFVHEAAHEEDAAPVGLEQILRRQRIRQRRWVEATAFVADADGQAGTAAILQRGELHMDTLADVVAVAMLDGVD